MEQHKKAIFIYMIIVAFTGLGLGLTDSVFSNYFRDAYNVDAFQRGLIEFPREAPGIISVFILSGLAFLGDKKLALIAQALSIIGIMYLGLFSPTFNVMLIFLFINSLGMHLFIPLYDSIGMSLAKKGDYGTVMGRFNSMRTAFGMLAGILVFVGFRSGFFSFTTPIIKNFLIAGVLFSFVFILLIYLLKLTGDTNRQGTSKTHFVFRKKYSKFYFLASLFGARKQIMFVYGPWVLIELLGFGADNMALLMVAGSFIGIFFLPMAGKWIDKHGAGKIMIIEAGIFLAIYLIYGVISAGLHQGWLFGLGVVIIAVAVNIADRTTMYFGMVRNIYMRSIAEKAEDVTPTLALGMAMDHVLSIASAIFCGWLWFQFGPQYVFVFAGLLAGANMIVARGIKKEVV